MAREIPGSVRLRRCRENLSARLKMAAVVVAALLALWAAQVSLATGPEARRAARSSDGITMQPPVTEQDLAQLREARLRAIAGN